jgi:pimeloyl-ACP methyl ester carboxylesterase
VRNLVTRSLAALGFAAVLTAAPGGITTPGAGAAPADIQRVPVTFQVANTNSSGLPCPAGGEKVTISGELVAPNGALEATGPKAVTLYLHGLDAGLWFWNFNAVPGYDHVGEMARLGHVSVAIDRVGYGSASVPGTSSCLGSQADVAHQIIGQLRSGGYDAGGNPATKFDKVALAGHSIGGAIAQIEAYSYDDIDALAILLWGDNSSSRDAQAKFMGAGLNCLKGGEPSKAGGPGGYTYLVPQDMFRSVMFGTADPAVLDAAEPLQNRNPCGDIASTLPTILIDEFRVSQIKVPVLLAYGEKDKVFPAKDATQGLSAQKNLYKGTTDVTEVVLADTGHFMTMEKSAPEFRAELNGWLCGQGFGSSC